MTYDPTEFITPDLANRPAPGPALDPTRGENQAAEQAPDPATPTEPTDNDTGPIDGELADDVQDQVVQTEDPDATADVEQITDVDVDEDSTDDAPVDEKPALDEKTDDAFYRRRRLRFVLAAGALAAATVWFFTAGPAALQSSTGQAGPGQPQSTTQDAVLSVNQLAVADQQEAAAYLAAHGTLDGFTITSPGARVAASGNSAVVSRTVDASCYMYGVLDGTATAVQLDPTGAACTDTEIAAAQRALDEQTIMVEHAGDALAENTFGMAADTVAYYGSKNFDATGQPSLAGLPTELADGITVTSNEGLYVQVRADINGSCKTAQIGADGTLGEISTC